MSVSGSGKSPYDGYGQFDPSKVKNDPALAKKLKKGIDLIKSSKEHTVDKEVEKIKAKYLTEPDSDNSPPTVKKNKGFGKQAIEDYEGHRSDTAIPDAPTRVPRNPGLSLSPSKALPELPKADEVAGQVFTKKTGAPKGPTADEITNNPLAQKYRKRAEYEGEVKLKPEETKAEKEFAEKAESHGYKFSTEFEMYLPIVEGSKEALTKEEMSDLIEGRFLPRASSHKKVEYEGRSRDLDGFASIDLYKFDDELGMYVSSNPFIADQHMTIDDMKEKMASHGDKVRIDAAADEQGYTPMPGMEGLYQNEEGDIRPAEDFK